MAARMAKKFNSGTWAAAAIVIAGVVLGLAALAIRPPPPKETRPATLPAAPRGTITPSGS
jgi:hypothetical protein